jgi:hypothetical protein
METVKSGTRCECREDHNYHNGPLSQHGSRPDGCGADAVRLVPAIYRVPNHDRSGFLTENFTVPMCADCAEYHEKKGA